MNRKFTQRIFTLLMLAALFASAFGAPAVTPALAQDAAVSGLALETGLDLAITDLKLSPPEEQVTNDFFVNDDITIQLDIVNNGDTATSNPFAVYFAIHAVGAAPDTTCGGFNANDWQYYANVPSMDASTVDTTAENSWYVTVLEDTLTAGDYEVTAFVKVCEDTDVVPSNNVFTTPQFTVNPPPVAPPANDNFANAEVIASIPFSPESFDPRGATREPTDPGDLNCKPTADNLDPGLATVWYTYTPLVDEKIVLDTIGSGYDTYIAVFKAGDPLEFVDCNDDSNPSLTVVLSQLPVKLTGGVQYYFLVGQFSVDYTSDDIVAQAASDTLDFDIGVGYEISGNAGAAGATLSYFDGFDKTVTADANGDYTIVVPSGWSGTVTPSQTGTTFVPASKTYTNVTADFLAENYKVNVLYRSSGSADGWILESGETTNTGGSMNKKSKVLYVGDNSANKQYRTILSFNTADLPDTAVVSKVLLKLRRQGVTGGGNPITMFGGFKVDVKKGNFGLSSLQLSDFNVRATKTLGTFKPKLVGGWYTINLSKAKLQINKAGNTQIRLRFRVDDNNNAVANILKLYSGNAGTSSRPQLIIEYGLP